MGFFIVMIINYTNQMTVGYIKLIKVESVY